MIEPITIAAVSVILLVALAILGTSRHRVAHAERCSAVKRVDSDQKADPLAPTESLRTAHHPLRPGVQVRLGAGVMCGMVGVVTTRCSDSRSRIALHCLQSGVAIEIDDAILERIEHG